MRRYLGLALACMLAAISFSALAMGLGEIRLNSYLNQRLDAEIELVSAAADEIDSLEVTLADDAVYERYGLERVALLNSLQFEVRRRPNGTAYIKVTSSEPIREPFLTLFVVADWSRGRLMREYTLLIDPPTFVRQEQAPEVQPEPQAPVVPAPAEPVRQERPEEDVAPVREPVVEQERQTGDVVSIPPLEADAEPIRRESVQAEPTLGGNYGPIQRNETLWGIARRLRPDDSVTINQMMIALFRANPEAFQGNINRLKAGYILRIPEYGEVVSMARRDAFNEVKRQNEEWRAGPAPSATATPAEAAPETETVSEPELTLVAPEEAPEPEVGTGVGAGGESDDVGTGAEEEAGSAEDDVEEDAVDLGVEDETADRLLDIEDESMQALQEQDETPASEEPVDESAEEIQPPPLPEEQTAEDAVVVEELPEEAAPVAEEEPARETPGSRLAAPVPQDTEQGLVERLRELAFSPLGLGIAAALLVLLLAGFLVVRKRREATQAKAAAAMAGWDDEADSDANVLAGDDEETMTVASSRDADGDVATVFEPEDAIEDETPDTGSTQVMSAESVNDFVETMAGGPSVTLDENDPLSEADFHMAYGLYDQAAEVVQRAVERDPTRKDYHAKLAEIHFAANNTEGFLESARQLKALSGPGDADWDNVAIMGRQIMPGNELFAEGGSTSSVDLDFGAAADEVAEAPEAPEPVAPLGDSLDFDISLDSDDGGSDVPEASVEEPVTDETDGLEFDLDLGDVSDIGGADEDDGMAGAPSFEEAGADESSDFDFDLGELDTGGNEAGDLPPAGAEEPSREPSGGFSDDDQTQTEFDKALQELSAFVDTNVPEQDAGDAVGGSESSELNLDDYSFDEDASAAADEFTGTGEDEDDIGEAGTKLDLARAYIDMGDPDGARGILEEVISDGDEEQQREARELLDQLS